MIAVLQRPRLDRAISIPSDSNRLANSPKRSGQLLSLPTSSALWATIARTLAFSDLSDLPFFAISRSSRPGWRACTFEFERPFRARLRPYFVSSSFTVLTRDFAAALAGPSFRRRPVSRSVLLMAR